MGNHKGCPYNTMPHGTEWGDKMDENNNDGRGMPRPYNGYLITDH